MGRAKRERRERIRDGLEEPIAARVKRERETNPEGSPLRVTSIAEALGIAKRSRLQFKPNRKQRRNRK